MKNITKFISKYIFIFLMIAGFLAVLLINPTKNNEKSDKVDIITTNFPSYDFARAVTKDSDLSIDILLKPGSDLHSYEPTPQDIISIKESRVFIYIGGESDEWVESIINQIDKKQTKVIKLMDFSNKIEENNEKIIENEHKDEEETEDEGIEYDEHIWTSIKNSIQIIKSLKTELSQIFPENSNLFGQNTENYVELLQKTDKKYEELIKNAKKQTLVFADRFPLAYFVNDYDLDYIAAFPGCAHETEASPSTVADLIDYIKAHNIKYIFVIELSDQKIANSIAEATNTEILEFHSAHNISENDFKNGKTYAEIMENNLKNLEKALK